LNSKLSIKENLKFLGFIQKFIKNSFQATLNLLDNSEKHNGEERLGPFFVRDVKDHKIQLKFSESISPIVSTDDNGRFHEKIIINSLEGLNLKGEQILKYIASDDDYNEQGDEGLVYLMKTKNHGGCSIISDIDDTIKISDVPHKKNLMINTFKKDFKVVPGNFFYIKKLLLI
jgi:phosphatidate phosphatase APP1